MVSSGLALESSESINALASIGEDRGSQEDAPSNAIFSAMADSITPGKETLSSARIRRRSWTIVSTFPGWPEKPSGTPFTTIVSVPKGDMSKPREDNKGALESKTILLAAPT